MLKKKIINYSVKKYSNPFFARKNKIKRLSAIKPAFSWKIKAKIIILFVLVIGMLAFLYFSSFFNIKHINISGNQKIASSEIEGIIRKQADTKRFLIGSQNNINLFSKSQLSSKLKALYYFEKLSINKDLPGTLNLDIEERKFSLIWLEGEKYYYIDGSGNVFSEADPLEIKQDKYPLVENKREIKTDGINVNLGQEIIRFIMNLFNIFNEKYGDIKIDRFILDADINTVKILIQNGPLVYFDTAKDASAQINKLIIIKEKLKNDFNNKQYIDLRYGDRVYYK